MELRIVSDNILLVDGEFMRGVSPEYLQKILTIGHKAIVRALDFQYEKMIKRAPEVQRGSVWVMHLAKEVGQVIMPELVAVHETKQSNRDVYSDTNIELVQSVFRPFWHAVRAANFIPEARLASPNIEEMEGVCLLVRDTPLID